MKKQKKSRARKVKVAIVGFGFMGRMHYGIWKKMKGTHIVALCDSNLAQFDAPITGGNIAGADTSTDYGDAVIYDDFDKMLAEAKPDVISLTLPTFVHSALTIKALEAGVSVLCEKPMSLSVAECNKMIKAAEKAPKHAKLMIGQCLRFWPNFQYIKKLIDTKKYGEVIAASFRRYSPLPGWGKGKSWFWDESLSGGVALDLHIHDSDLVQYLFGLPKAVTSHATYRKDGLMQYISTLYDLGNITITGEASWCMSPVCGFEANFIISMEKATIIFDAKREKPLMIYPIKGKAKEPKLRTKEGYYYEIEWFLKKLKGEKVDPITSMEESRNSVDLIEAERRSAKTGRTVKVGGAK